MVSSVKVSFLYQLVIVALVFISIQCTDAKRSVARHSKSVDICHSRHRQRGNRGKGKKWKLLRVSNASLSAHFGDNTDDKFAGMTLNNCSNGYNNGINDRHCPVTKGCRLLAEDCTFADITECGGNGNCVNHACECNDGWDGFFCEMPVTDAPTAAPTDAPTNAPTDAPTQLVYCKQCELSLDEGRDNCTIDMDNLPTGNDTYTMEVSLITTTVKHATTSSFSGWFLVVNPGTNYLFMGDPCECGLNYTSLWFKKGGTASPLSDYDCANSSADNAFDQGFSSTFGADGLELPTSTDVTLLTAHNGTVIHEVCIIFTPET